MLPTLRKTAQEVAVSNAVSTLLNQLEMMEAQAAENIAEIDAMYAESRKAYPDNLEEIERMHHESRCSALRSIAMLREDLGSKLEWAMGQTGNEA